MTGTGDSDDVGDVDDVGDSPWSADDVPVRSTPLEFAWTPRARSADEPVAPVEFRDLHVHRTDGSDASDGDHSRPVGRRRRALAIAGALALAVVVVLVAVRPDDPAAAPTRADTKDETPDEDEDAGDDVTTTVAAFPQRPPGPADEEEATDAAAVTEVELPPAVAAIRAPTEIVMVNDQGSIVTLSLPSGSIRTVHTDTDTYGGFSSDLVVTPNATATGTSESGVVIVPRSGPPLAVEPELIGDGSGGFQVDGWYRSAEGGSVFTVMAWGNSGPVRYLIDDEGRVTLPTDDDPVGALVPSGYGLAVLTDDGSRIVNDAGGAYEVAPDGSSRRIDDGVVHSATGDVRLVRRCDEGHACTVGLVTASTGGFAALDPALLPDDFDQLLYGATLSPDGQAVALRREHGVPERVIVVFGVGETASSPFGGWSPAAAWAADGSGVFDIPNGVAGVQFTGVDGGEPVVFGEDLGQLITLGVRWPDAEIEPTRTTLTRVFAAATPVGPTGITLVAAARTGSTSYIDIDAGRASTWETGARLGRLSATMLAGSGGETLVLPESAADAFVTSPAREQVLAEVFSVDGDKLPGPDTDTVWVPTADAARDGDVVYFLLPIAATSTDEAIARVDIPGAELIGGDGSGALVVSRGGDVFVVDPAGSRRLTSGELIALRADTAYIRECDDPVSCTLVRVDRVTDERTPVDVGDPTLAIAGVQHGRGAALSTSIAPGGDVIVAQIPFTVEAPDGTGSVERSWAFVDLTDHRVTVIDDLDARQPVIWSPDARFAVVLSDRQLQIYDRAAGAMIPLDLAPMVAIGPSPPDWAPVP